MTASLVTRAPDPAPPDVVGYVEAATTDRILGWAWAPGAPELRAKIALRLGETVVADTVADLPRPDLVSNGIGDGRHAYDIAIPPEARARAAELRVFAQAGDGPPVPIGATPVADGLSEQVAKLLRGMDALMNSQRVIHRNLQAALTTRPDADGELTSVALKRMSEMQTETAEQLSAVERFVVRLDEQLSQLSLADQQSVPGGRPIGPVAAWALALAGIALAVSVVGLVRSLGGW